jgi:hypothetical protein
LQIVDVFTLHARQTGQPIILTSSSKPMVHGTRHGP